MAAPSISQSDKVRATLQRVVDNLLFYSDEVEANRLQYVTQRARFASPQAFSHSNAI
jgi:hypothetical protein